MRSRRARPIHARRVLPIALIAAVGIVPYPAESGAGTTARPQLATGADASTGAVRLIGADAFVVDQSSAGPALEPVFSAAGEGYAILGGVSGFALPGYTIRLVESPGIERHRTDVAVAAAAIAAETGLTLNIAPGTIQDRAEAPGEILVRVATSSPCGLLSSPGVAGCGGPTTFARRIVSGEAFLAPELPCSDRGISVVAHELGHAFGLAHYSDEVGGLRQLMYPSTASGAPGPRAGDRAGLRALAGRPSPLQTLRSPTISPSAPDPDPDPEVDFELAAPPIPSHPVEAAATVGSLFSQPAVQRVLDTRSGLGLAGPFLSDSPRTLDLSPVLGSAPIDAVVLNLTATGTTASGYVTAYPDGTAVPATSSLNYTAGRDTANLVIVKLGPGNKVALANVGGSTDLIADVFGVFSAGGTSGYVATDPTRVLDSRESAVPGERGFPFGCGDFEAADVTRLSAAGVPLTQATASIINLTAANTNAAGFVSLRSEFDYPVDGQDPSTSNLNPADNDTRANLAITPGAEWLVQVSSSMRSDVIADLAGWFVPPTIDPLAASFVSVTPSRVLDTRVGLALSGRFAPNQTRRLAVAPPTGIDPAKVTAVVINLTAVEPNATGYLTALPAGGSIPNASNVNYVADAIVPNLAVVKVAGGAIDLFTSGGSPDVLGDVMGFFVRP